MARKNQLSITAHIFDNTGSVYLRTEDMIIPLPALFIPCGSPREDIDIRTKIVYGHESGFVEEIYVEETAEEIDALINAAGDIYSEEAQAVFANMDSQPPTALKTAMAAFVDSQVLAGNWDKIIDFGTLNLNTEANSLKGYKGVAAPSNSSAVWNSFEGYTTNGTSSFISFGFIPNNNADFGLNDCGIGAYIHVNQSLGATSNALIGCIEAAANTKQLLVSQTGVALTGRINVGNTSISYASDGNFDNESFYAVERTASNACRLMKGSAALVSGTTASAGKAAISPYLGGRNSDGVLSIPIKASFKYWVIFKAVGFDYASFVTAAATLITDLEYTKVRILVVGDSIARGTSTGANTATADTLKEYNGTNVVDVTTDVADAVTGSPYPGLASSLFSLSGRVTHLVNTGTGGSNFSPDGDTNDWSTTGTRYAAMTTKANNYLATQPAGTTFDFIRITLGVNDATGAANLATIDTDAISLIDRLTTDYPTAKIIINQIGKSTATTERETSVRATIDSLVSTYANVYAGTDLNTYPEAAFYDGLHLTPAYNNQLGEDDAAIINALL